MLKLLEELSNACGVSGNESHVRHLVSRLIKPHADDMYIDGMGNLICRQKGDGPKVMLAAHMDEIGLCVKNIDDLGHIYFSLVGGISEDALIGQYVHFHLQPKGELHGVITHPSLHNDVRSDKAPSYAEMYIDTGLSKAELLRKGVHVGTSVVFSKRLSALGNKNIVAGKALDDRVGCAILIELAERMKGKKGLDIYYVFTVQEEVGLYGAKTAIYQLDPDWGIAVDATSAEDASTAAKGLGKGPFLTVKDAEFIANPFLLEHIVKTAQAKRIPFQYEVSDAGTTDALSMSLSKGGVATCVLAVGVRNLHSTISLADLRDIEAAVELLEALLRSPPKVLHKRKYSFFK